MTTTAFGASSTFEQGNNNSFMGEARDTVSNLHEAAAIARASGNGGLFERIKGLLAEVLKHMFKFAKIAFTIAVHKFVIEMAAQILTTMGQRLMNSFNGKKDMIVSADVANMWGAPSFQTPNQAAPQGNQPTMFGGRSSWSNSGAPAFNAY